MKRSAWLLFSCWIAASSATAAPAKLPPRPRQPTSPPATRAPAIPAKTNVPSSTAPAQAPPAKAPGRYALLVGCTKYPDIEVQQLEGPGNDVVLIRRLLESRFQFLPAQIVTLAEAEADAGRKPTRANIQNEFAALAGKVKPGDQVVIFMAGHGSRQPDAKSPDDVDAEPDGMDEVFLPADTQPYDRKIHGLPRAIVDDELGRWTRAVRDAGAAVWIIVDCCHSGTIIRGDEREIPRRAPPELLIPRDELDAAKARARPKPRTRGGEPAELAAGDDLRGIAALYASQPEQSTVEMELPEDADDAQTYGLLTYTLAKVLHETQSPLTYRELAARIHRDYVQSGRTEPMPLLEGADRDREVLGLSTWPNRSLMTLQRDGARWTVNAGALQGLSVGSVLKAFPPAGSREPNTVLGHLRIKSLAALSAEAAPCAYAGLAANATLPDGARCEVVYVDWGLQKLRVAIDAETGPLRQRAQAHLTELAKHNPLVEVSASRCGADWVLHAQRDQWYLEPGSGMDAADPQATARFGPAPADDQLAAWLEDRLRRIARARHLLSLARDTRPGGKTQPDLKIAVDLLLLSDRQDKQGKPLTWGPGGITLEAGQRLGCRITNRGKLGANVTLLYVDSGFGIQCVYPAPGVASDLYPGEKQLAFSAKVTDRTVGFEHLVLLAVPRQDLPIDFSVLQQPTLSQTRSSAVNSPLLRLLETSLYGTGTTRGQDKADLDKQQLGLFSFRVIPAKNENAAEPDKNK